MTSFSHLLALVSAVGPVRGGVQCQSRSVYARFMPRDPTGELFGFYNLPGKFAVIIGPLLKSGVGLATGDSRTGILLLVLLFALGVALLRHVPVPRETA